MAGVLFFLVGNSCLSFLLYFFSFTDYFIGFFFLPSRIVLTLGQIAQDVHCTVQCTGANLIAACSREMRRFLIIKTRKNGKNQNHAFNLQFVIKGGSLYHKSTILAERNATVVKSSINFGKTLLQNK